jgi:hypothetical protein
LNRFNLLHHDKIIVLYMVYLILFFAEDNCLVLLVHDSNGHYHVVVSLYWDTHGQVVENTPVGFEVVVDFH